MMKISKVLITGIAGAAGSYLAEYLCTHHPEIEVHGIARFRTDKKNLQAVRGKIQIHEADLMDFGSMVPVVDKVNPDAIYHLAAYADVRASFTNPSTVLRNNIIGTSNLCEVVKLLGKNPAIQLCSTSEVYGQVEPKDIPIREDAPFKPASPYAVSKVAQDMLGWTYFAAYKMPIVRTRMFSYLNPRRSDLFASAFARQIALIECGCQKVLLHGNLESVRSFIDVRDAMHAYWLALMHGEPGEVYNIGSTEPIKVGEVLDRLIRLSRVAIPTQLSEELVRPADVTMQIPCIDKFVALTGWRPHYSFDESLNELITYWRRQAAISCPDQPRE
jgi:GDP-4-dehydro-6-deoxy-D-mannose reductase